jgi:hypothetical protein
VRCHDFHSGTGRSARKMGEIIPLPPSPSSASDRAGKKNQGLGGSVATPTAASNPAAAIKQGGAPMKHDPDVMNCVHACTSFSVPGPL